MIIDELADLVELFVQVVQLAEDQLSITDGFRLLTGGFPDAHEAQRTAQRTVSAANNPGTMISHMADDDGKPAWTSGERAAAVLAAMLALGLLFIAVDVATGGKLTGRGCGCNDDQPGD